MYFQDFVWKAKMEIKVDKQEMVQRQSWARVQRSRGSARFPERMWCWKITTKIRMKLMMVSSFRIQ